MIELLIGVWLLEKKKIFLLTSTVFWEVPDNIEVLYLDNDGWEKYVATNRAYEIDKKLKEEKKAKEIIDEF